MYFRKVYLTLMTVMNSLQIHHCISLIVVIIKVSISIINIQNKCLITSIMIKNMKTMTSLLSSTCYSNNNSEEYKNKGKCVKDNLTEVLIVILLCSVRVVIQVKHTITDRVYCSYLMNSNKLPCNVHLHLPLKQTHSHLHLHQPCSQIK